jgi:glycosyltransferase involved in cell wall biosynthesis
MPISIAMATYNGARFIGEQLQSFAAQSLLPNELVVTDDGSSDDTLGIVERFAASAPFAVHIHRNPARFGYSRNFERAISLCTGDIIFLSDQDDVWFPDKVETVVARFDADEDVEAVLNGQILTDTDLNHRSVTMLDNVRGLGIRSDALIEGCCTAFRRRWGALVLPIPTEGDALIESRNLSHDQWLNQFSVLLGVRAFIERPLQYFRRHGDNTTRWLGNAPKPVTFRDLVATRMERPPADAWLRRVQALDLYVDWLTANRSRVEALGIRRVDQALQTLNQEKCSLAERAALASLPIRQRLPRVWKLWLGGGYRYFYGWKSALRDLSRSA